MCLTELGANRNALRLKLAEAQTKLQRKADDYGFSVFIRRQGEEGAFSRFTWANAKTAQLSSKAGPWTQYPERMIKLRARAFACRDKFGDALRGLRTAEEIQDVTERDRFAAAKPALVSSSNDLLSAPSVTAPDFSQKAETATVDAETLGQSPEREEWDAAKTDLENWMHERGFTEAEIIGALLASGLLETPAPMMKDWTPEFWIKIAKAKTGLASEIKKARGAK